MTDSEKRNLLAATLMVALVGAHGIYWFVGGSSHDASPTRNLLVGGQIVLALGFCAWAGVKMKRASAV